MRSGSAFLFTSRLLDDSNSRKMFSLSFVGFSTFKSNTKNPDIVQSADPFESGDRLDYSLPNSIMFGLLGNIEKEIRTGR